MKMLMNKLTHYLRYIWLKKIKKCRTVDIDWGDGTKNIYSITDNQKVIIAANFSAEELSNIGIPKATTHFYAKDTNTKEPYKGLTTWVNPDSIKYLHCGDNEMVLIQKNELSQIEMILRTIQLTRKHDGFNEILDKRIDAALHYAMYALVPRLKPKTQLEGNNMGIPKRKIYINKDEKCKKCGGIKKSKVSYENGSEKYICLCDWVLPKIPKQL